MSTAMYGADADELERAAMTLRSAAAELDDHAGSLTTTLGAVAWVGGVATRFGARWSGGHRPRILATASAVRDAADQLDRNAAEQRLASGARSAPAAGPHPPGPFLPSETADRGSGGSVGPDTDRGGVDDGAASSSIADPGTPVLDRLDSIFSVLGVGRDVLELIGEHAELLDGIGVDELLDVVSTDGFLAVLQGLDAVIDLGDVVVDLVVDFVEHPALPFDERVVHALADAATRFGLDQGAEQAATFLAQAASAALVPGLGAALAPFAGKAAGVIADAVMGVIIDAVDGATDFVDRAADAAVAAYRAVKETFGVILDAAGAAIDVAGAAIDLTADAAGVAVDAGVAVLGGVADAGGTVGGWLGL